MALSQEQRGKEPGTEESRREKEKSCSSGAKKLQAADALLRLSTFCFSGKCSSKERSACLSNVSSSCVLRRNRNLQFVELEKLTERCLAKIFERIIRVA